MNRNPVADRYAHAIVEFLGEGKRLEQSVAALETLAELIRGHRELAQLLINPDVEAADKVRVIGRLLGPAWSDDVRACVDIAVAGGRAEDLPDIAQAARELVEEQQRIVHVRVRSAHPLSDALRADVVRRVEARERRTVRLTEDVDAQLIGGIQVYLDHRVWDGSIASQLRALRQRLKSVRVH